LAAEKAAEHKQHVEQAAQAEAQIQALDSLRYDLEQAKANLTAKLEMTLATNTALEITILEVSSWLHTVFVMQYGCDQLCSNSTGWLLHGNGFQVGSVDPLKQWI